MPRLNLNKDMIYDTDHDGLDDYYGVITDVDLPMRESFRTRMNLKIGYSRGWYGFKKINSTPLYKYVNKLIERNVGNSFDLTYSYYCKKTKHISDSRYEFNRQFKGRCPYYQVDSDGLIQRKAFRGYKWWERPVIKPRNFTSFDYKVEYRHRITGEVWERNWHSDQTSDMYTVRVISGYLIPNVYYLSNKWKKLTAEYNQASKRANRIFRDAKKNKVYNFLTKSEMEVKASKIQDNEILFRHGFDEESFRGEYYHGRKNKKK